MTQQISDIYDDAADAFDADIAITTRELAPMIAALVEAMGGAA